MKNLKKELIFIKNHQKIGKNSNFLIKTGENMNSGNNKNLVLNRLRNRKKNLRRGNHPNRERCSMMSGDLKFDSKLQITDSKLKKPHKWLFFAQIIWNLKFV